MGDSGASLAASDAELARAVANGDETAFLILYRRYGPVARRSAARAARRHPQLDVDEVTHLALTRLWTAMPTFDDSREFAPWAAVVIAHAVRTAATATRSIKSTWNWSAMLARHATSTIDPPALEVEAIPDPAPSTLEGVLRDEQQQTVAVMLTELLSDREGEVLRMRLAGWTYAEIAQRLDIDTKAIDNAMRRCLGKLRRAFSDGTVTLGP